MTGKPSSAACGSSSAESVRSLEVPASFGVGPSCFRPRPSAFCKTPHRCAITGGDEGHWSRSDVRVSVGHALPGCGATIGKRGAASAVNGIVLMSRSSAGRTAAFICFAALVSALPVFAATYYVDATGATTPTPARRSRRPGRPSARSTHRASSGGRDPVQARPAVARRAGCALLGAPGSPIVFGATGAGTSPHQRRRAGA